MKSGAKSGGKSEGKSGGPTMRFCPICGQFRPIGEFYRYYDKRRDGYHYSAKCKKHMSSAKDGVYHPMKPRHEVNRNGVVFRECKVCRQMKPLSDFGVTSYTLKDGTIGRKGICKDCFNTKQAAYTAVRREARLLTGKIKTADRYRRPNIITILNPDRSLYQQFKVDRIAYCRFRQRVKNSARLRKRFHNWLSTNTECETVFILRLTGITADYSQLLKENAADISFGELNEVPLSSRKSVADGWGKPTDLGLTDTSYERYVASKPIEDPLRGYNDSVLKRVNGSRNKRVYSCAGANRYLAALKAPEPTNTEDWVSAQELQRLYGTEKREFIQKDVKVRIARVCGRMRVNRDDIADSLKRFEEWKNPPLPESAYKPDGGKPTPRGAFPKTTLKAFIEAWSR